MKKAIFAVLIFLFLFLPGLTYATMMQLTLESYSPADFPTVSKILDIPDLNDQLAISFQARAFAISPDGWNLAGIGAASTTNKLSPAVGWVGTAYQYWVYGNTPLLNDLFGYTVNQQAIDYGDPVYGPARILTFHTDELVYRLSHNIGESPNNYGIISGSMGGIWTQLAVRNWGQFYLEEVPVPEPSTVVLLLTGLFGLTGIRKFKKGRA